MAIINIKPSTTPDGQPLKVRLPNKPHEFMPAKGISVERSPYWVRRINDGSVVEVAAKKTAAKNNQEK